MFPSPSPQKVLRAPAFAGSAESLATAKLAKSCARRILFIARDALHAAHLAEEIAFFAPRLTVSLLPDWEILPYDSASPSREVSARRIGALVNLMDGGAGVTVTAATTALFPYPPPSFIVSRAFNLQTGARLNLDSLLARLARGGYSRVERVLATGEFAVYGGQVDVFAADSKQPFRLVLFDDEIEEIRLFDPQTQRSTQTVDGIRALPAGECDLSASGISLFRRRFIEKFGRDDDSLYRKISDGKAAAGMEFLSPLFFEQTARLFDYLPPDAVVLTADGVQAAIESFTHQARMRQKIAAVYENRAVLPAGELFLGQESFHKELKRFSRLNLIGDSDGVSPPPPVAVNHRIARSHRALADFINGFDGTVMIAVDGEGRRESLILALAEEKVKATAAPGYDEKNTGKKTNGKNIHGEESDGGKNVDKKLNGENVHGKKLGDENVDKKTLMVVAPLRAGFVMEGFALLTESDIFQIRLLPKSHRQKTAVDALHIGEIRAGDLVVHRDYGIGRCKGLQLKTAGNISGEFLEIAYADEQRLWLPVSQCHLLCRHHGGELSRLGGESWKKARRRAMEKARDTAARLLSIHAARKAAGGVSYRPDEQTMARFAAGFAHEETSDQQQCINDVLADLRAAKPMDRLVSADVGFGKTEIAMRAAAAVALCGAQTALLAPTTLLAEQHLRSFADRFAGFPLRVGALTRLTDSRAKKKLLADLENGKVDIIIGAHSLLQKSAKYHNLGLVIVDEEHRFGVRHKEHFKSLRANVDILSLSATPIPRTLGMAMDGLRDLSLISTPPQSRLAIKTVVAKYSHALIQEALERELLRGGQIYFVHNEIRTIAEMGEQLAQWLPRLRVVVAHGQMAAAELELAMRRFLRHEADVLLCTTIVESGLDIANANTIIINRADKMGISRLHQLRGRVGRSHHQGYAYFLTWEDGDITQDARRRLDALGDYSALGGGFLLAMRDLEIRGAGEILGEKQSGEIETVGCALYQKMVNAAARELQGKTAPEISTLVDFRAPMLLPEKYVYSPSERMRYYWRLAECETAAAVDDIQLEWEDRFGKPPAAAKLLILSHRLRLQAESLGAEKISVDGKPPEALIYFQKQPPCADNLLRQINDKKCVPAANGKAIKLTIGEDDPLLAAKEIGEFLQNLMRPAIGD